MFAEKPVTFSKLPSFRAEHFPYSGPYPWLDRDDALEQIEGKLERSEISSSEAEQCRHWVSDGYIVIKNLIDTSVLDTVWAGYEGAIASGRIKLPAEPAGSADPYPGRYLNPHKKVSAFCRVLKHPGLLHW